MSKPERNLLAQALVEDVVAIVPITIYVLVISDVYIQKDTVIVALSMDMALEATKDEMKKNHKYHLSELETELELLKTDGVCRIDGTTYEINVKEISKKSYITVTDFEHFPQYF